LPNDASISALAELLAWIPAISYRRAHLGDEQEAVEPMTEPLDHHDALIYAMVTISAVDRVMTDAELARIGEIVSNLPVFADYDQNKLIATSKTCGEILGETNGLQHVLQLIRSALPKKLRETAYAMALEVAAADLNVRPEETRFLEMLSDSLKLDKLTTAAIERGIRARNMVL
jgi:tellurite resistance protein